MTRSWVILSDFDGTITMDDSSQLVLSEYAEKGWERYDEMLASGEMGFEDCISRQFGINHEKLVGKKILLEVDPSSDYNVALSGFVSEAKNNGEPLYIVTNRNSALHSVFSSGEDASFLLLASKIHYSQQINENETIVPASDVSILLDACVKIQESHQGKTLNLLFDNVSDIVFRCGIDKTYKSSACF
jgi:2-hydroxy-3-keto-5-methylthiopentenyl-1-phosphate phosphatase